MAVGNEHDNIDTRLNSNVRARSIETERSFNDGIVMIMVMTYIVGESFNKKHLVLMKRAVKQ